MRTIQQLQDAADKERSKAEALRAEAKKNQLFAADNMADPNVSSRYANIAQKDNQKAAQHDQSATKYDLEKTQLEARAVELNRRKTEIQDVSQSQINKLDQEERAIRG